MNHVPRWMRTVQPGQVEAQAATFRAAAAAVNASGVNLAAVLAESAGVLGWRSEGALEARKHVERADGQTGRFRDLLDRVADALRPLESAIAEHAPELQRLLASRPQVAMGGGRASPGTPLKELDGRITVHTDALALADRTARDALGGIGDELRALGAVNREDDWVGDAVPAGAGALLGRYGVTAHPNGRALLDKIVFLPLGPLGDSLLRHWLAQLSPEELADLLLRHPDVARRLTGGLDSPGGFPPGSPEGRLTAALAESGNVRSEARMAAIQAAFARMTAQEQQRIALLYPEVVGNLDGAPLPLRVIANRVKIGISLDDERTKRAATARHAGAEQVKDNQKRIEYYSTLLYDDVDNPTFKDGSGRPRTLPHQILLFDNSGDGRIAEMWGTLDANTKNVGVFVPGTSADMENFWNDSGKMRDVASADRQHDTVTVAWLGVDMPDDARRDAMSTMVADIAGPALRDFFLGLDIPPTTRTTAIGHSYGGAVVGTAEKAGLAVDQVLHIASAGAGHDVWSAKDYPNAAHTKRFSMTAPGDLVGYAQGMQAGGAGHGADPDELDGVIRLDTGRYPPDHPTRPGQMLQGRSAHADVTRARHSTAWDNIVGVVTGGNVTLYTDPNPDHDYVVIRYPYENPDFNGPVVDMDDAQPSRPPVHR